MGCSMVKSQTESTLVHHSTPVLGHKVDSGTDINISNVSNLVFDCTQYSVMDPRLPKSSLLQVQNRGTSVGLDSAMLNSSSGYLESGWSSKDQGLIHHTKPVLSASTSGHAHSLVEVQCTFPCCEQPCLVGVGSAPPKVALSLTCSLLCLHFRCARPRSRF